MSPKFLKFGSERVRRADQSAAADAAQLDASIAASLVEMNAGGGIDLDVACDAVLAELSRGTGCPRVEPRD